MAGFRLPCFKSLATSLSGASARLSTGHQQQQLQRLVRPMSSASVKSSEKISDNVVYSRHEDCFLHTQTTVQRFFEQASLWPNHTAVVRSFMFPHHLEPKHPPGLQYGKYF